jgi:galactokinase
MTDSRLSRTAAAFETAFGAAPTLFVQAPAAST